MDLVLLEFRGWAGCFEELWLYSSNPSVQTKGTSPISNEIVGMTKFKLSSDSSSVTEQGTAAFLVDDYKTWSIS